MVKVRKGISFRVKGKYGGLGLSLGVGKNRVRVRRGGWCNSL